MNLLLLLFALPLATIIFSIVLQKLINCPILVALTAFAVYLILAFSVFDESFLVYAIVYTIIAYITAAITRFVENYINNNNNNDDSDDDPGSGCDFDNNSDCGCNNRSNMIVNNNYEKRRYWR